VRFVKDRRYRSLLGSLFNIFLEPSNAPQKRVLLTTLNRGHAQRIMKLGPRDSQADNNIPLIASSRGRGASLPGLHGLDIHRGEHLGVVVLGGGSQHVVQLLAEPLEGDLEAGLGCDLFDVGRLVDRAPDVDQHSLGQPEPHRPRLITHLQLVPPSPLRQRIALLPLHLL
jgi:hypothetical protein